MISSKNLAIAIYEISKDSNGKEEAITNSILTYIKNYKLESLLPKVIEFLENKIKKESEWNTLSIKSEISIDESIKNNIKIKLKATEAQKIENKVEEGLIGGFVATYKGVIYDASIYNQLQLLRESLIK
ncbi:MAG: F0F1 ATP synthase subunit delta [Candidatus Pacebacteria bacterium]|nr:F0F1 ATP synthase subunit delta [Candidatus Paceibacterota bacterium]